MLSQNVCNSVSLTKVYIQRLQAYQKCLNHLLLAEISNKKKNLKVLLNELSSVKSNLLPILNFLDFNHVCNIIISNNEKSILKCRYTHKKKLRDLILGCEVNPTRFLHNPNKVIFKFSSYVLTEYEKSLLCKSLRFPIPRKKIEYDDFLTQFEILYRDTIMFEMKSENRDFLKSKLKDISFSTLKSYSFDKVEKTLSEVESIALKNLIERTKPARDVPVTSTEGPLKVLRSGISRGPSGDSQGTNTKIDDLMKILLF